MTLSLRIAWSFHPSSIQIGIAATIFTNIGTILLYFVDLFFAQRIIRAQHPRFGWSSFFTTLIPLCCVWTVLTVVAVIVVSIQSFYTESINTHRIDRDVQLYVETAFTVIAFIPCLLISTSALLRLLPSRNKETDDFGKGSMRTKILLVLGASLLLTAADAVKAGTSYMPPTPLLVPNTNPPVSADVPWYFSRGIFYGLGLAPELVVLYIYALFRVHERFVVANGAKGPHSYAAGFVFAGERGNEKTDLKRNSHRDSATRQLTGAGSSYSLGTASAVTVTGVIGGRVSRSFANSIGGRSVVSWGGTSRTDTEAGYGGDEGAVAPYSAIDGMGRGEVEHVPALPALPVFPPMHDVEGAREMLGINPANGHWELRPISHVTTSDFGVDEI